MDRLGLSGRHGARWVDTDRLVVQGWKGATRDGGAWFVDAARLERMRRDKVSQDAQDSMGAAGVVDLGRYELKRRGTVG